jgi:hypothetical protein
MSKRKPAHRQEGAVLLIVLMMVMMAAGLGTFAASNATYELRAAGGVVQGKRLARAGEAFAEAVGSRFAQLKLDAVAPPSAGWTDPSDPPVALRQSYGLPGYNNDTAIGEILLATFENDTTGCFPVTPTPDDAAISAGAASPYRVSGRALVELWEMPAPPGEAIGAVNGVRVGRTRYRAAVTAYTSMLVPDEAHRATDTRGLHENVGVARAFYDFEAIKTE